MLIAILLTLSFLNWVLTIRYCNHASFMVGAIDVNLRILENIAAEKTLKELGSHSNNLEEGNSGGIELTGRIASHVPVGTAVSREVKTEDEDEMALLAEPEAVTHLKRSLRLVALHFAWGFRFIFLSVPFFFYSAGIYGLIPAAIVMFAFVWYFDDPKMTVPVNKHVYSKNQKWQGHDNSPVVRKRNV